MAYALCSSKGCNNKVTYYYGRDAAPKYCGKCGSLMISKCPSCGAKIEFEKDNFCKNCGKPYK